MLRALVGGLLVAVGTAASLLVPDVHGFMIVTVVACAALAAGLVTYANSLKKNVCTAHRTASRVTLRDYSCTELESSSWAVGGRPSTCI